MAVDLALPSVSVGGPEGSRAQIAGGRTALPDIAKKVGFSYNPGYHRFSESKRGVGETLRFPNGEKIQARVESEISQPLRDSYIESTIGHLDRLIAMRRDYATAAEFNQMVNDSGHGNWLRIFEQYTEPKPGGKGYRTVNEDLLRAHMESDEALLADISHLEDLRLIEESLLAGGKIRMSPVSPEPETLRERSYTYGEKPRPIRKVAKNIRNWWITRSGRPGGRGLNRTEHFGFFDRVGGFLTRAGDGELQLGEGRFSRFFLDTKGRTTLTVGGAMGAGAALGSAFGPGGAAVGALVPALYAAGQYLSRDGENMEFILDAGAVQAVEDANPALREWYRRFYDLDPDRHSIEDGTVRIRRGRSVETVRDAESLQEHLIGLADRQMRFQRESGVRNQFRDPMLGGGWILDGLRHPPQTGDPFMQRVVTEFAINRGGLRDRLGNSPEAVWDPALPPATPGGPAGNWRDRLAADPAFEWDNLDTSGNLERWWKAYNDVLGPDLKNVFNGIKQHNEDNKAKFLDDCSDKRKNRAKNLAERQGRLDKEGKALERNRGSLQTELEKLTGYRRSAGEVQKGYADAQRQLTELLGRVTIGGVGGVAPADADELLLNLNNVSVRGSGVVLEVTGFGQITEIAEEENRIRTTRERLYRASRYPVEVENARLHAEANPITTDPPDPVAKRAQDAFNRISAQAEAYSNSIEATAQARLDAAKAKIQELRTQVEAAQRTIRETEERLESVNGREAVRNLLEELRLSRRTIEGYAVAAGAFGGGPAIDLATAALDTQPMDILMRRINQANGRNRAFGWLSGANFEDGNRAQLLLAVADAHAEVAWAAAPRASGVLYDQVVDPAIWAISELDAYTLSPEQIRARLTERLASGAMPPPIGGVAWVVPDIDEINTVKRDATARFDLQLRSLERVFNEVRRELPRVKGEHAAVTDQIAKKRFDTPELDTAERLGKRYGPISDTILGSSDPIGFLGEFLSLEGADVTLPGGLASSIAALNRAAAAAAAAAGLPAPAPIPVPPELRTNYADYEIRPAAAAAGTPAYNRAMVNIYRTLFDAARDTEARFQGESGPEAAHRRNMENFGHPQFLDLLLRRWNLGVRVPDPAAPGTMMNVPITEANEAIRYLRVGLGIDPIPPATEVDFPPGSIEPADFAEFLSEDIFQYMVGFVETY